MSTIYESDKLLAEYLLFHFGSADEILPPDRSWPHGMHEALDFAVRTATYFPEGRAASGLDLGCAVGRSAFEMSRYCREVTGIDFSHTFIRAARSLCLGNSIVYQRQEEASVTTSLEARLPAGIDTDHIRFLQGDAMNLPADLGAFDFVHAANLLCRLPEPNKLLARLPNLVNNGGTLVLATPCTWLEEFTPQENWPADGTLAWLENSLTPYFDLMDKADEPFLIRETARKFQWTTSLVTVWHRRDR